MTSNRTFLVLIAISIGLIVWGKTETGRRAQLYSSRIISNLIKPIHTLTSISDARKENRLLRERLANLTLKKRRLTFYKEENRRLKELLSFKERVPYSLIPMEIIGFSPHPEQGVILVDKGSADGIREEMVAITIQGLIGVVRNVERDISFVQTLYNPGFRASAMNSRTRAVGIVRHRDGLVMDNIPIGSLLGIGDTVITSGLGGIFPEGLLIGRIKEFRKSENMLFYVARLEPFSPMPSEYLFIIAEVPPQEPEPVLPPPPKKIETRLPPPPEPIFPEIRVRE